MINQTLTRVVSPDLVADAAWMLTSTDLPNLTGQMIIID